MFISFKTGSYGLVHWIKGLTQFWKAFTHDSTQAQKFQMLMTPVFEEIKASN